MKLNEQTKVAILEAGEESLKTALDQVVKISKVYAASTENTTVDDSMVAVVEMIKKAVLDDLVEQINPND